MADSLTEAQLAYRQDVAAEVSGADYSDGVTAGKLWLPIWSGEVIHAYDEYNQFEGMVQSKTIPSGTTVEIPITGTVGLTPAWNAGVELQGGADSITDSFQLKLDKRPMAAHFEIDNVDLMLTQWEFRAELARQAALTLANTRDKQIYSYLVRAAVTSQLATDKAEVRGDLNLDSALFGSDGSDTGKLKAVGTTGGSAADRATGALSMLEKIEKYVVYLQENNIPYGQLYLSVSPRTFMDIRSLGVARSSADLGGAFSANYNTDAVQTDQSGGARNPYFAGNFGLGGPLTSSYGQLADTLEYMGCTIIKTNHGSDSLRNTKAGTTLGEAKYNLDFTMGASGSDNNAGGVLNGVRGLMFTPEAVGAIRLQGLKVDTVDDVRRNTVFTVASMMSGTGVLKPECAAIIHTLNGTNAALDTRAELAAEAYLAVDADGYA